MCFPNNPAVTDRLYERVVVLYRLVVKLDFVAIVMARPDHTTPYAKKEVKFTFAWISEKGDHKLSDTICHSN